MRRVETLQISLWVGIVAAYCQTASGDLITPVRVISSTSATDLWPASNLINNSGLSAPVGETSTHADHAKNNSWVTAGGMPNAYYYVSYPVPVLTFELDRLHYLHSIVLWNYAADGNAGENGARLITVDFSQNGVDGPFSGGVEIELAKGYKNDIAEVIELGGSFPADAVRLTITDNHYDGAGIGGDRVGLSEVKFIAPEPSSLVLTGTVLWGLACFVFHTRKRQLARL